MKTDYDYIKYDDAAKEIHRLNSHLQTQATKADEHRLLRHPTIDIDAEQRSGHLAPDELYIPLHLVDMNIRREQARYVSYISSSRRVAIFKSLNDVTFDSTVLEEDFTDKARYTGWQTSIFRIIDSMQLHGYGVAEVSFDVTKPGHFAVNDVNFEDLGLPEDARDIQACEMIVHRHYFTDLQLKRMAETDDFNKEQVNNLDFKELAENYSLMEVQKVLFKKNNVVYVGWACIDRCNDWVRKPRPLFLGKRQQGEELFETQYPYVLFPYNINEDTTISLMKGRAELDEYAQESATSLLSSFVTAHRRASGLYFAKDNNDPNNTNVQTSVFFTPNALIDSNIKQFQLSPPDSSIMGAIQTILGQNMQETSQVNFAAMNRKDSRKTATEVQAATSEAQALSASQVALFSIALKKVYTQCWNIYRLRTIEGLIQASIPPNFFTDHEYSIRPAGDADVIERQEKINKMMQAWPVVQQTGAASLFLKRFVSMLFPEDGQAYVQAIQDDNTKTQLLMQLQTIVQSLITDPETGQLSEEAQPYQQQLQQIMQQVQQVLNPNGQQPQPTAS
tara:strand:- start:2092 stop:3777 length:1686 start_codon:yes stop_codon:yes gene_type:complete